MATLIKTDGTSREIAPKNKKAFTLDEMQAFVGGFIEIVGMGEDQVMIVNEEGLLKGLGTNTIASMFAGQHIVGDVLFATLRHAGRDTEAIF